MSERYFIAVPRGSFVRHLTEEDASAAARAFLKKQKHHVVVEVIEITESSVKNGLSNSVSNGPTDPTPTGGTPVAMAVAA